MRSVAEDCRTPHGASDPSHGAEDRLLEKAAGILGGSAIEPDGWERIRELHEKLGEPTVQRDFLERAPEIRRPERQAMIDRGAKSYAQQRPFPERSGRCQTHMLAPRNITENWKNPPISWHAGKAQLPIQYGDRSVLSE
jgi:hypothetical protein